MIYCNLNKIPGMRWQEFIRDFLTFTKKERIGIIVIICLILLIFFLPKFVGQNETMVYPGPDTAWINRIAKVITKAFPM